MAFNRNAEGGGKGEGRFDIGQDFRQFLDQQNQPLNPNAPNEPGAEPPAQGNDLPNFNVVPPQPPTLTPPSPEAHMPAPPTIQNAVDPNKGVQGPRDRQAPSAGPAMGGNPDAPTQPPSIATPPRPMQPTPIAGGQAAPVTPLTPPSPMEMVKPNSPQQFDMLGKGSMLGGAGGLLGGGLGSPGQFDGSNDQEQGDILPYLLQLLASGQKGQ